MAFSPEALQKYLPSSSAGVWWIALSGGLDSCVLIHAIAALHLPVKLHAIHINHQISPNANDWQKHCANICAALNISFTAVTVSVKNTGRGIEDAAREARYAVFEGYVEENDCLLAAHHADDQSETMLLRLIRGTGPRGLSAMASIRPLGLGKLYRPLLNFSRQDLEIYAHAHQLRWVSDESNFNDHYDRNYLRNHVMPLLRDRWPAFTEKWQQTANLCAENEILLEELAAQDLLLCDLKVEIVGTSLHLPHVKSFSADRRNNLLRAWLRSQNLSLPEHHHLPEIEEQILNGRQDAEAQVNWGNLSLRVYQQRIYALPVKDMPSASSTSCEFATSVNLCSNFRLRFDSVENAELGLLKKDLPNIYVTFRQGGERCRPVGRAHSQTLKKLFQEYNVAPWLRRYLPLVYSNDNLVAVGDLWICEGFQADASGYRIKYERIPKPL